MGAIGENANYANLYQIFVKKADFENAMAEQYAANYSLIPFAGTDNHNAHRQTTFGGMRTIRSIISEADFVSLVKSKEAVPFIKKI